MADDDETMTPQNDPKMEEQEEKEETQPSDDEEEEEDEDEEEEDDDETELSESIAKARPRRSGAGALMPTLLNAEAEKEANDDDHLALLFAEEEDDEDFDTAALEAAEARGEAEVMSDSDDDENDTGGAGAGGDEEYEGEMELIKKDRAEKMAKKRKAHEGLKVMAMRKRARIAARGAATAAAAAAAPRPKKKSERISWLPTPEEGPVRASSRRQTMQNKELTHARLKDSEEKRVRLIATMEEAARRKEKLKPKEMTQEDRLAEAEKTERLNSKALNRWEEMEKRKSEEQRARLEALHNRRLEGPVLTFWSGLAKWINGKLGWVGDFEVTQVPEKEPPKRRKANPESPKGSRSKKAEKPSAQSNARLEVVVSSRAPPGQWDTEYKGQQQDGTPAEPPQKQITFVPPQNPENFLDGIHLYASMPAEASQPAETTSTSATPQPQPPEQPQPEEQPQPKPQPASQPNTQPQPQPQPQPDQALPIEMEIDGPSAAASAPPPPPPVPKVEEVSSRNLIILENFETTTPSEREQFETSVLFNSKKAPKPTKPPQEMCVITSQPARYRDPETGLPYANAYAYREIRRLLKNQFGWSSMLGCFVGPVGFGARGVPERFLGEGEKGKETEKEVSV